jgi:hypothetical protein
VLARLDKIPNVEQSFTNYSGTMIRVTVAPAAEKDKVAKEILKVLTDEERKPVRLLGDDFEQALRKEEWRESKRVAELSVIEVRTLILRRMNAFAEKEKLDKEVRDKLAKIAEEELQRIAKSEKPPDSAREWRDRCNEFSRALIDRAKDLLPAEQLERLKEWFKEGWWLKQGIDGKK